MSRTSGRAVDVDGDTDAGFVRTVRVDRMGGLAKSGMGVDVEGDVVGVGLTIGRVDGSCETDWAPVGRSTVLGGYRDTNDRSNARAPSTSPNLQDVVSCTGRGWLEKIATYNISTLLIVACALSTILANDPTFTLPSLSPFSSVPSQRRQTSLAHCTAI